jgi:Tol biopolymer transport system component
MVKRAFDGFFVAPAFSPAGDQIATSWSFEGGRHVLPMPTTGTTQPYREAALTTDGEPRPAAGRGIAWSPDGQWIAYITHSPEWDTLVLTDMAGENFQFPVGFSHANAGSTIRSVGWSPDSAQLVFSAYDRRNIQTDLWTVDVDGSNLTQITDTPRRLESSPDYSPDGSVIAFVVSNLGSRASDVAVMAPDGTARNRLQTPRLDERQVAWGG